MRLDKFLKVSRIIKRRTIAKLVIDSNKAKINGKIVKSSYIVKEADTLELEYFNKYFKFKILEVPSGNVSKEKTSSLVELIETNIKTGINLDSEADFFE